jgi:hypothetical protein
VWCFSLLWALVLHCFPGCFRAGAAQRLCRPEFLRLRFCPSSNAIMRPSFSFSLSQLRSEFFRRQCLSVASYLGAPTWTAGQGLVRVPYVRSCRGSVRSSLGSARFLSDRAGSLSDRHLAQPDLCPIVSDLYPIVILLCLLLRVVCRWPDSFCDLLFGSSFVIDL